MGKAIIITLVFFAFMLNIASADCEDQVFCQNQDKEPFCLPQDASCTYKKLTGEDDNCVIDTTFVDNDDDNDLWSSGCDAFPDDETEWFDLDGDGIGDNADCDSFDLSNKEDCSDTSKDSNDIDDKTNSSESNNNQASVSLTLTSSGDSSGSGGGCSYDWQCDEWSSCSANGVQTRACTNGGSCLGTFGKPAEEQSCTYVSPAGGEEGEEAEEEAEEEAPQEEAAPGRVAATTGGGLAGITGRFIQNVFGGGANAAVGIFMVLLTVVGGLVFYSKVWKKRK